jgi:hypothetical protein
MAIPNRVEHSVRVGKAKKGGKSMQKLIVRLGDGISGTNLTLPPGAEVLLGRYIPGQLNNKRYGIISPCVSAKHACLGRSELGVFIVDLGSTNGTFINNKKLVANVRMYLQDEDELWLARPRHPMSARFMVLFLELSSHDCREIRIFPC